MSGNIGSPKNLRHIHKARTTDREQDGKRKRENKGEGRGGGRRYQGGSATNVRARESAWGNLYQPPEARGRRYGSRTTPDISGG